MQKTRGGVLPFAVAIALTLATTVLILGGAAYYFYARRVTSHS